MKKIILLLMLFAVLSISATSSYYTNHLAGYTTYPDGGQWLRWNETRKAFVNTDIDSLTVYGDVNIVGGDLTVGGDITGTGKLDIAQIVSDIYMIDSTPAVDSTGSGTISILTAGENIDIGEVFYMKSDGEIYLADADGIATMQVFGIAVSTGTDGVSCDIMTCGYFRDDAWAWTPGALLYASETAGGLTATAPSDTDDVVQVLGIAISADVIYFDPERTVIVIAAP